MTPAPHPGINQPNYARAPTEGAGTNPGIYAGCILRQTVLAHAAWSNLAPGAQRPGRFCQKPRPGVVRHQCASCGAALDEPLYRQWICRPCRAEQKRAKLKTNRGTKQREYAPKRRRLSGVLPHEISDWAWSKVAKQNALDAWQYWLSVKAPQPWLDARDAKRKEMAGPTRAERFRAKYNSDPEFRLRQLLRNYRRKAERGRYGEAVRVALKNATDSAALERKLGLSVPALRAHLERQFTRGMSWERFAKGEIHIDHIVPLSSFDMSTDQGLRAAWALSNLRPLWARDNLRKGAKRLVLL